MSSDELKTQLSMRFQLLLIMSTNQIRNADFLFDRKKVLGTLSSGLEARLTGRRKEW